jgi:RNA polymerase sigma factor (sigma-70 family)
MALITMTPSPTDLQLIEWLKQVANHKPLALRQLYDATSARLFSIALRVVGNRELAEDVLQDAFVTIWRVAKDYRDSISPPMVWLGLIVRSRALDFLRRRLSDRSLAFTGWDEDFQESLPGEAIDPVDFVQCSEQAWALHCCLKQLNARQRALLIAAYFKEASHSELAKQFDLPLGTVKSCVRRGLAQLRICMERYV